MREPDQEPTYFTFSSRRLRNTSSSTPVSPHTTGEPVSPLPSKRSITQRPSATRTVSDYATPRPRLKVRRVEEDAVPYATIDDSSDARASSASRQSASIPIQDERIQNIPNRRASLTEPPCKSRPGRSWSRTKSGSVWYERIKGSPAHSKKSSAPSQESDVPKHLLIPLTPPTRPAMACGQGYHHRVKVEQSFTSLKTSDPAATAEARPSHQASSHASSRSSVDPLRLFSASFQTIRRLGMLRRKPQPFPEPTSHAPAINPTASTPRPVEMLGHKSLLKRIHTSEALQQVTSLLHETASISATCSPVSVIKPLNHRQMSDPSGSSKGSKPRKTPRMKAAKELISTLPLINGEPTQDQLAVDEPHSYSTSQLEFKMGGQPTNTPDERATYRVKRSPSAESEEFLKVDISIHGGTSYLPSEARRIHTPPLPQEGPDGKRRGFFFDYTAPRSEASRQQSIIHPSPSRLELPNGHGSSVQRSRSPTSTVHKQTFSPKPKDDHAQRVRTGDWYDAKLAELDETEDEADSSNGRPALRGRSSTTRSEASLARIKQRKQEEQLDFNIPEHLPNSPLCPRNSKYWRVVKGRGSQYRGCWMHGIGLWGEGEVWHIHNTDGR